MRFMLLILASLSCSALAANIPDLPGRNCPNCTAPMQEVLTGFFANPSTPELTPRVYSGDCYFLSRDYNPRQAHRGMVFLDQNPIKDDFYFATGFTFFGSPVKYADWTVENTRPRVEGAWNRMGPIETTDRAFRVISADQQNNPRFVHYLRQNQETGEIYYISYWGGAVQISFCKLTANP